MTELQSIMTSMKTLSQLELRKLGATADNQREMAQVMREVVDDYFIFFQGPKPILAPELLLVIGSERGFCGPFNELLDRRCGRRKDLRYLLPRLEAHQIRETGK